MGKHWVDGKYAFKGTPWFCNEVKGEVAYWRNLAEFDHPELEVGSIEGTWKYGEFHETMKEIEEKTGVKNYNLEIQFMGGKIKMFGVLNEDGQGATVCSMMGNMDEIIYLTPEVLKEIQDAREHDDHCTALNYKIQPENQGKILWLTGPPGAGKSTTGQYLAKHQKDYVYFEADCFFSSANPFISLDVAEPSLAQMDQKPLAGRSLKTIKSIIDGQKDFDLMIELKPYDIENVKEFSKEMALNVLKHKNRLGGNFAVAFALPTRVLRESCKEVLGDQLIFVCLRLTKEANAKRIATRHADSDEETLKGLMEYLNGIYDLYEDTQEDETNCVTVYIGPDDDKEAVMKNILKAVEEYEVSKKA